jgi:hypothetical protein
MHRGVVTGIGPTGGVLVEIPTLATGSRFGPCDVQQGVEVEIGDRVLVSNLEDVMEDFVVVAKIGSSVTSDLGKDIAPELAIWYSALANREAAPANMMIIGDSIWDGGQVGNYYDRNNIKLAQRLQRLYPLAKGGHAGGEGGLGYVYPANIGFGAGAPVTVTETNPGDFEKRSSKSLGEKSIFLNNGASVTFTTQICDRIRVIYDGRYWYPGSANVEIDGIVYTSIVNGGGAMSEANPDEDGRTWVSPVLQRGFHRVRIVHTGGFGPFSFGGVEFFDGDYDKGVHVYDAAHYGATTTNYTATSANTGMWEVVEKVVKPQLTMIALGTNDIISDLEDETFWAVWSQGFEAGSGGFVPDSIGGLYTPATDTNQSLSEFYTGGGSLDITWGAVGTPQGQAAKGVPMPNLLPNTEYTLLARVKSPSNSINMQIEGSDMAPASRAAAAGWQEISVIFRTGPSQTEATPYFFTNSPAAGIHSYVDAMFLYRNDSGVANIATRYLNNIDQILNSLKLAMGSTAHCALLVVPFKSSRMYDNPETWEAMVKGLYARAGRANGKQTVSILDMNDYWPVLGDGADSTNLMFEATFPIHPNARGMSYMADIVLNRIAPARVATALTRQSDDAVDITFLTASYEAGSLHNDDARVYIYRNNDNSDRTITLPAPSSIKPGTTYEFRNYSTSGGNRIVVTSNAMVGGKLNVLIPTLYVLPGDTARVVANGTQWGVTKFRSLTTNLTTTASVTGGTVNYRETESDVEFRAVSVVCAVAVGATVEIVAAGGIPVHLRPLADTFFPVWSGNNIGFMRIGVNGSIALRGLTGALATSTGLASFDIPF